MFKRKTIVSELTPPKKNKILFFYIFLFIIFFYYLKTNIVFAILNTLLLARILLIPILLRNIIKLELLGLIGSLLTIIPLSDLIFNIYETFYGNPISDSNKILPYSIITSLVLLLFNKISEEILKESLKKNNDKTSNYLENISKLNKITNLTSTSFSVLKEIIEKYITLLIDNVTYFYFIEKNEYQNNEETEQLFKGSLPIILMYIDKQSGNYYQVRFSENYSEIITKNTTSEDNHYKYKNESKIKIDLKILKMSLFRLKTINWILKYYSLKIKQKILN